MTLEGPPCPRNSHPERKHATSDKGSAFSSASSTWGQSVKLSAGDPARSDFAVAVVTAHFAAAVVARPNIHDATLYDAALTLDRGVATAVANSVLTRLG